MTVADPSRTYSDTTLTVLTWNIGGFSRDYQSPRFFSDKFKPLLIFLSEPLVHSSDLPPLLRPFHGRYEAYLNSEDTHDPDLALETVRAHVGTMEMWHVSLSPYVTITYTESSHFQTVLRKPPAVVPSLHISIYK